MNDMGSIATEADLRRDLAAAFQLAAAMGYSEGVCNHFSAVVRQAPGDERYLINPFGPHWSELTADDLLTIDGDGRVLAGEGEVEATARFIHVAGHRANARHRVLLHVHMPYATALTMLEGGRLEMAHQTAVRFFGRMARHPFGGIALDENEGERIADAQAADPNVDVIFLENHGVTVGGPTVATAFDDLYYLERACRQQIIAQSTGLPLNILPDDTIRHTFRQIEQIRPFLAETHFRALTRIHGLDA